MRWLYVPVPAERCDMEISTITNKKTELTAYGIGNDDFLKRVLIVAQDNDAMISLRDKIALQGLDCSIATYDEVQDVITRQSPHVVLAEVAGRADDHVWDFIKNIKKLKRLPVIVLITEENLAGMVNNPEIDDFIIYPFKTAELLLRMKRLLKKSLDSANPELIKCDGLTIDLATCEVTVDGKKADLTFKEYELLKLMASNRGRVFTREALLDKIWGYDYYGGDRTVDVHMRRLRSKIEDGSHTYIETVRNIGYRFVKIK